MTVKTRHPNKFFHNWLIYRIGDRLMDKYSVYYKGHMVDLGCGEAPFKEYFLQYADSYTGVDWSDTLHNSKADVISDLNKEINLADKVADTLISLSVMEHLNEPQQFLNEAYRVLKAGGHFVLQVPWQWHIHEDPHDYFRYSPFGLRHMLTKAGFSNIEIEAQSGFFSTAALKFNYFTARAIYKLPAVIKYPLALIFLPFWTLGQLLAPLLDKLDKDWDRETTGFYLVASKL